MMLIALDRFIFQLGRGWLRTLVLLVICVIGFSDYWTGFALQFELFYLSAVALATWYGSKLDGQIAAVLCSALSIIANTISTEGLIELRPIVFWNGLDSLLLFLLVAWLLAKLHATLKSERQQARTDNLTGYMNNHAFMPALQYHLDLAAREQQSITLAYLDVDNFKIINDTWGHAKGDQVLKQVADIWRTSSRRTDLLARVGGDEFCMLFPNTDQAAARNIIEHARVALSTAFSEEAISVTCSVGAITFRATQLTRDEAIRAADVLMYRAKKQGKNNTLFEHFDGSAISDKQPRPTKKTRRR